jgi:hypothetical protein
MKIILSSFMILFCLFTGYSQDDYPEPEKTNNRLFYIQHSNNHNTYVYDANVEGEGIDATQPIDEYRILYAKNGETKPLSRLQRKMAYGMKLLESEPNLFTLRLVSTDKITFYLNYDENERARIYVTVNGRKIYLDRMFIKLKDGFLGFNVKVEYVLFYGEDCNSDQQVMEKILVE